MTIRELEPDLAGRGLRVGVAQARFNEDIGEGLRSGCLGAVALWQTGGDDRSLRRLQLAAGEGACHGFVFRPSRHASNPSPAALRLKFEPEPGALRLRVLKCRGAVAPATVLQRLRSA